ncbi:MAG: hypothetical protein CVU42_00245 [Chloroflexi bacterium HGW-Chloroflexi-4]|jgi:uncharacterized protein YhbP (UPF0306 family)|nr:MAG: hypothetical protein CVU42_00245 [Chloroflexi bacterium HGW-Chloroflexi-4]
MPTHDEVIDILDEYLRKQTSITIANYSESGLWISNMFYGYALGKIFFSSKLKTRHAKEIGDGSQVAFSIANSSQTPASKVIGIQGVGFCHPSNVEDYPNLIKHYGLRFAEYADSFGNLKSIIEVMQGGISKPFTIDITMIKFLNKEVFGGYQIIEFHNSKIIKVYPG